MESPSLKPGGARSSTRVCACASLRCPQTFTRVTKPLASLGRARALLNESATLADRHILEDTLQDKQALEQRIAANDRAVDHEL